MPDGHNRTNMSTAAESPFAGAPSYKPRAWFDCQAARWAALFTDAAEEYRSATEEIALFDFSMRGLLRLTGSDRRAWLHNLITNAVTTLDDHAGNYAFALDRQGRIQFDLNVLCVKDALLVDLARFVLPQALRHFDRHLFTEDVKIEDFSQQVARLAVSGPRARLVAEQLGVTNFAALPALRSVALTADTWLFRHDFAGREGFELIVPRAAAAAWWERLVDVGARPTGFQTLDLLRIEAGVPWLGRDLDDRVLPPESGQQERGVSHHKGCYLGHEIIERMRSRGVCARRLVRLRTADGAGLGLPAPLQQDGREVGRVTSLVAHPCHPLWVGLGFLSTSVTDRTRLVAGVPPREVVVDPA